MKFLRLISSLALKSTSSLLVSSLLLGAVVVPASLSLTGCTTADKIDTSTPEGLFKSAEEYESQDRYEEAITRYSEVKNKHPYSRFATEAELKIADLQFKRDSFIEAAAAYQLFKEFHPKHPKIDYVTYRLGLSYFSQLPETVDRDLTVADKAILYFDEVINTYPHSEYLADAKAKRQQAVHMQAEKEIYIADFYTKREIYDSALKRYEYLLKTYPNEGFDARALYGATNSAYQTGEKERAQQYLKNLYSLYPSSDEAKRAKHEFEKLGSN